MKRLIIIGASGHGKVVADIATKTKKYSEICFLDDNSNLDKCMEFEVIGKVEHFEDWVDTAEFFVAIGNNRIREMVIDRLMRKGAKIATLIHPNACVGVNVEIGSGTVIMAGAVINADCKIGNGVILNTCCSVDHDCSVEDYCHVSVGAHLCGTVSVGKRTMVGAGATVINNINICDDCMIGAGAVVVKDLEKSGTYVGVPVKN